MLTYFVVDRPQDWPFEIPGTSVLGARHYLTEFVTGARRSPEDASRLSSCESNA